MSRKKDDEDGVQDQGSLDEPQKSTKSKGKAKGKNKDDGTLKDDFDPDNPVDRVADVPLRDGEMVVPEGSLDQTQNENRPAEQG